MGTVLLVIAGALSFLCYGYILASVWSWAAKRHVAFVQEQSDPSLGHDLPVLMLTIPVACLPPLLLFGYQAWTGNSLETWQLLSFIVAWLVSAAPAALRARRIMQEGGLDPDAA